MTGLCDFTRRTHQVFLIEQLTGLDIKLTTDHLFIQTVVTVDNDIVDSSLRTFGYSHFKINRVAVDILLNRCEIEEKIAVVHIVIGNRVIIL